ncbi:MAG: hypothetical protein ACTHMM_13445 [Agriterribacter sp.]
MARFTRLRRFGGSLRSRFSKFRFPGRKRRRSRRRSKGGVNQFLKRKLIFGLSGGTVLIALIGFYVYKNWTEIKEKLKLK